MTLTRIPIPPSPPQSSDEVPSQSFQDPHLYQPVHSTMSEEIHAHLQPMHYGSPPQYLQQTSNFPNVPTHPMMMADPNALTPPTTGDESSLPFDTPPFTNAASPSPSWSPPRTRGSQRMKGKQVRRQKNRKDLSDTGFKLEGPISSMTENFHNTPIRDMDAWVTRSAYVRQEEVRARNGKISRPMNSFMLYRSAYAERTKRLVGANNHQIVSRVAGMGWKMEPVEIRGKYEHLAKVERDNHAASHPDYKFSPMKNGPASRRETGTPSSMPSRLIEESSFSDMDSEFGGSCVSVSGSRPSYTTHSRHNSFEDPYYDEKRDSSPFGGDSMMIPNYVHMPYANTSHPTGMVHPSALQGGPRVEDGSMNHPHPDLTYGSSLAGLPGATHHELLQPPTHSLQTLSMNDMDPRLLTQTETTSRDPSVTPYYDPSSYPAWNDETAQGYYPSTSARSMSASPAPYAHPGMGSAYLPSMHMESREQAWDMPRHVDGMPEAPADFEMWCTTNDPMPHY